MIKLLLFSVITTACCLLFTGNSFSQGTAINSTGAAADSSAMLDVSSSTKGFLLPRMSSAGRNAIVSPAQSLLIFNTTTTCFEYYYGGVWYSMSCTCQLPPAPLANAASDITAVSFTANWTASTGATTYYIDVATDAGFTSFVSGYNNFDAGNVLTQDVSSLTCGTTYYYRVRANNSCGTSSNSNSISQTTSACFSCGGTLAISHTAGAVAPVSKSVDYGTILSTLGGTGSKCWITQNLGSDNQASSATDATEASAGWYWQFNLKQGYKHDGTTRTPATAWITSISENSDWTAANDPCTIELGAGWRIPTSFEWNNADINGQVGGWDNYNETFADELKLHAAGYLWLSTGALTSPGSSGLYWSSSQFSNNNGIHLSTGSGSCYMNNNEKWFGFSLRCIKD